MGIKHLWTVLTPFCERKPLYELQGKTVAVDLSCWICEAQNIAEYEVHPRMYLRNLYFRTCYLLLIQVNPVFVLEGRAPELKYDTIAARNALQFKGAKPKTDGVKTGKDRSRFNFVLRNCEEMLRYMGISCLTGNGEAESLCAYLDDEGLVDGCISQDSDCFAYGAKTVYRNFSIASQGAYSASGGAVDIYDITKIKNAMKFGRNKIVAMALLCGSDYGDGIHGIGKESVMNFFENLSDEETLDRLRSWRYNTEQYDKYEKLITDNSICTSCGHHGNVQRHSKNGCGPCSMTKGCLSGKYKEERLKIKNELAMRSKSLKDPDFPNEQLINEFLTKKDRVSTLELKWKQPDLIGFVKFATKYLQWEEIYSFEKMLPILTRWQCLNCKPDETETLMGILQPDQIKKIRNPKGIPSYEIIWSDPNNNFQNLIPQEQIELSSTPLDKLWSTIEPQVLVNKAYPKLVEQYQNSKIKPKKTSRRRKKDVDIDQVDNMLKNTSISEPIVKKTRKPTKKKDVNVNELADIKDAVISESKPKQSRKNMKNETKEKLKDIENNVNRLESTRKPTLLDNFLKTALHQNHVSQNTELEQLETGETDNILDLEEFNCYTSTPTKSIPNKDVSGFGDENNDSGLSDIVENIISRKPFNLEEQLKKINIQKLCTNLEGKSREGTQSQTVHEELNVEFVHNREYIENADEQRNNVSSFFISEPVNNDFFEKTFNDMTDCNDDTVEYEFNEIEVFHNDKITDGSDINGDTDFKEIKNIVHDEDDSFSDIYVSLIDKLKKKSSN